MKQAIPIAPRDLKRLLRRQGAFGLVSRPDSLRRPWLIRLASISATDQPGAQRLWRRMMGQPFRG